MTALQDRYLLERFLKFAAKNIGVIADIEQAPLERADFCNPGLEFFRVTGVHQDRLGGSFPAGALGFGQSDCLSHALVRALGEGIERIYSGFLPQDVDIRWATHHELHEQNLVLPLEDYQVIRASQETQTHRRFRSDDPLKWIAVQPVSNPARSFFYPLSLCSLRYDHGDGYDISTTNGVGLGSSIEKASISALMELIERDALMRLWWLRQIPRRLRAEDIFGFLSYPIQQFLMHVRQHIHIFDLTDVWSVPVAVIYLEGFGPHQPKVHLGASSGFTFAEAIEKCLQETVRIWSFNSAKRKHHMVPRYIDEPYDLTVKTFEDIEALTFQMEAYRACQFLKNSEAPVGLPSSTQMLPDWNTLSKHIESLGARLFRIDFSPDFLSEMGFSIVRIRSPEMIALNCTHAYRPWGSKPLAGVEECKINQFPQLFL